MPDISDDWSMPDISDDILNAGISDDVRCLPEYRAVMS